MAEERPYDEDAEPREWEKPTPPDRQEPRSDEAADQPPEAERPPDEETSEPAEQEEPPEIAVPPEPGETIRGLHHSQLSGLLDLQEQHEDEDGGEPEPRPAPEEPPRAEREEGLIGFEPHPPSAEAGEPQGAVPTWPEQPTVLEPEPEEEPVPMGVPVAAPPSGVIPVAEARMDETVPAAAEVTALPPAAGRWIRTLLLLVILLALAVWVLVSAAHVGDRYSVRVAEGSWIALAKHAGEGVLYPPLYDAESQTYGGTRYMPMTVLLHAGMASLTGDDLYITSGKILCYASAVLLLATVFVILLTLRCPALIALGLVGTIILAPTGLEAATAPRGDALPVFLQLLALGLMARRGERGLAALIVVGVLCALAMLCKLPAIWAAMAIGLWLLFTRPRNLLWFAIGFAAMLLVGLGITWLLAGNRFFENLFGLLFAGSGGIGSIVFWAPRRLMEFITNWAPVCWVLLPLAGLGFVIRLAGRQFTLYHLSLLTALLVLLVMFADAGVGENHLIVLLVLSVILAGDLAGRIARPERGMALMHGAIAMVVIVCGVLSLMHKPTGPPQDVIAPGRDAVNAVRQLANLQPHPSYDPTPLNELVSPDERMLSEDPYIPVSLGRTPVVLDSFMLKRMEAKHPEWIAALVDRIDQKEFDRIVLIKELDVDSWWYRELFFGPTISTAIERNYVLQQTVAGYYIYEPITAPADEAAG